MARALVLKPSVLLFDEPLSNLDARLRRQMREEIRELQQRLGLTVVYVTHDQQEAMAVSDRIIVMNAGRIEQQGAPRDLYERPATPFLARFMGESNPARGTCAASIRRTCAVRLGDVEIDVANATAADGEATVAVRPEAITVERRDRARPARWPGTIAKASYLGTHMEYSIDTAAGTLFATCPRVERPLAAGDAVALVWRRAASSWLEDDMHRIFLLTLLVLAACAPRHRRRRRNRRSTWPRSVPAPPRRGGPRRRRPPPAPRHLWSCWQSANGRASAVRS